MKAHRYLQTFFDVNGGGTSYAKYEAGKSYPVTDETSHHVAMGIAEEIDVPDDAEKATAAAEAAQVKADAAQAKADAAAAAAQAAQDVQGAQDVQEVQDVATEATAHQDDQPAA